MILDQRQLERRAGLVAEAGELAQQRRAPHELLLGVRELAEVVERDDHPHRALDGERVVADLLRELDRAPELLDRGVEVDVEPGEQARRLEERADLQPRVVDLGRDRLDVGQVAARGGGLAGLGGDVRPSDQGAPAEVQPGRGRGTVRDPGEELVGRRHVAELVERPSPTEPDLERLLRLLHPRAARARARSTGPPRGSPRAARPSRPRPSAPRRRARSGAGPRSGRRPRACTPARGGTRRSRPPRRRRRGATSPSRRSGRGGSRGGPSGRGRTRRP